jgi:hypothetical protein
MLLIRGMFGIVKIDLASSFFWETRLEVEMLYRANILVHRRALKKIIVLLFWE